MVSNMKRYKNTISRFSNVIKKGMTSYYSNGRSLYPNIGLIDSFYGLVMPAEVSIDVKSVKVIEDSYGVVYIGLDLSRCRIKTIPYNYSVLDVVHTAAYPRLSWYGVNSELKDALEVYINPSDVSIDKDVIKSTPVYDAIKNAIYDIENNSKVYVELRDKEFPRLEERNFLPILIIDFEKNEVNYCDDSYADSYRKSRKRDIVASITDNDLRTAIRNVPFNLIKCDIKYKYIKTCN